MPFCTALSVRYQGMLGSQSEYDRGWPQSYCPLLPSSGLIRIMTEFFPIISVVCLVITVTIGIVKKINSGLVGITMAMLCGVLLCGISPKSLVSAWPQSLCMAVMGMTFLFSIAKNNGTLTVLAEGITGMIRGQTRLLPICFFLLPMIMALSGVAVQANVAVVAPLCMEIGNRAKIKNLDVSYCVMLGACAGTLSPINPSGMIASALGESAFEQADCGGEFCYTPVFLTVMAIIVTLFIAVYFIRGMFRLRGCEIQQKRLEINREQVITMAGIVATVLSVAVFKTDTGLTAFSVSTILLLLRVDDQKRAIQGISWFTIILLGGMSLIIFVVREVGGIDLIAGMLSSIMTKNTAVPIMSLLSSAMASVASASGVVMPALLPTVSEIMGRVTGVDFYALYAAVLIGAHTVNISPLSVTGSLCLVNSNENERNTLFVKQFIGAGILSIASAVIIGLLYTGGLI